MIRQETYHKLAKEFSTSIGVATTYNVETFTDNVKKIEFGDDINPQVKRSIIVNDIIIQAIEEGKYQQLCRRVWGMRRRKVMESTIYKKAWKDIQSKN
jgi:hypothetical protein